MTSIHWVPSSSQSARNRHLPKEFFTQSACHVVMAALAIIAKPTVSCVYESPNKLGRRMHSSIYPKTFEKTDDCADRVMQPQKEAFHKVSGKKKLLEEKIKARSFHSIHLYDRECRIVKFISPKVPIQEDRAEKNNVVKILEKQRKLHKFKASKKIRQLAIQKERDLKFINRHSVGN